MNVGLQLFWENPIDVNEVTEQDKIVIELPFGALIKDPTGSGGGSVFSVNGKIGTVVLNAADVGAEPLGSVSDLKTYTDNQLAVTSEQINQTNIRINNVETNVSGLSNELNSLTLTVNGLGDTSQEHTTEIADINVELADHETRLTNAYEGLYNLLDAVNDLSDNKLDKSEYVQHFKGVFPSYSALIEAYPTATDGDYAHIDSGSGFDRMAAIWDSSDSKWVVQETGIASNTDEVPEGQSNLYFTNFRAVNAPLTGLVYNDGSPVISTDSIVGAFGKVQNQLDNVPNLVRGVPLTGLTPVDNIVIPTDSILQGFNKLQGQFNGLNTKVITSVLTGFSPVNAVVVASDNIVNAFSKVQGQIDQIVNNIAATVRNTVLTGLTTANTPITATDTVLSALGKLQGQISNSGSGSVVWQNLSVVGALSTNGTNVDIQFAKIDGIIWIRGSFYLSQGITPNSPFIYITNADYKCYASRTGSGSILLSTPKLHTSNYLTRECQFFSSDNVTNDFQANQVAQSIQTPSTFSLGAADGVIQIQPTPLGKAYRP